MFYILAALIGEITFMFISIFNKRLRNRNVAALSIMTIFGMTFPFWSAISLYFVYTDRATLTPSYMLFMALWLGMTSLFNFGNMHLARFQSLSEATGYRFGFTVLVALLFDTLFFGKFFSGNMILAILITFCGGLALSFSRQRWVPEALRMNLWQRVSIICFLSLIEVVMYALYKKAYLVQPYPLFHVFFSQAALFFLTFCMGWKRFRSDYKAGHIPAWAMAVLMGLILIAGTAEGLAIGGLPLTVITLFFLIRAVIFAIHDIKSEELPLTLTNGISIALIVTGIIFISLLRAAAG